MGRCAECSFAFAAELAELGLGPILRRGKYGPMTRFSVPGLLTFCGALDHRVGGHEPHVEVVDIGPGGGIGIVLAGLPKFIHR